MSPLPLFSCLSKLIRCQPEKKDFIRRGLAFTLWTCPRQTQVVGAIAEFEHSLIRERIALGLERARAQGKTIGRPLGAQVDEQELRRLRSQGLSLRAIAKQVGISHPTVASILNGKNPTAKRSLEGL